MQRLTADEKKPSSEDLLDILIPALLKTNPPMLNVELETKNIKLMQLARKSKSQAQLIKELEEQDVRYGYVVAALKTRATTAEKKVKELNDAMELAENTKKTLETDNQLLKKRLGALHEKFNQSKNESKKWNYGLACLGILVGAALCATGAGLLAGLPILGISSLILGSSILFLDVSFIGYKLFQHCKSDNPPDSPSSIENTHVTTQSIALPSLPEKPVIDYGPSYEQKFISTKPLFSPPNPEKYIPSHESKISRPSLT